MKADLSNAELDELDELLSQAPAPCQALDVVMLDGYLAAVAVQPRVVPPEEWLGPIFEVDPHEDGEAFAEPAQATEHGPMSRDAWQAPEHSAWRERTTALIVRRFEAIVRDLQDVRGFNPVVGMTEGDAEPTPEPVPEFEPESAATPAAEPTPDLDLGPYSRNLAPWASGFWHGAATLGDLLDHPDDAAHIALSRIFRHLPVESEQDRELREELDRESPLSSEEDAIEELINAVADLWDITLKQRYAVRTVRHEQPKVGRNDPCPCGSGRKFKQCHGKA